MCSVTPMVKKLYFNAAFPQRMNAARNPDAPIAGTREFKKTSNWSSATSQE